MHRLRLLLLSTLLGVAACGSVTPALKPVVIPPPVLPPPPAEVMVTRQADFQTNLLRFLSPKPPEPTK